MLMCVSLITTIIGIITVLITIILTILSITPNLSTDIIPTKIP